MPFIRSGYQLKDEVSEKSLDKNPNQEIFYQIIQKVGSFGLYQKVTIILWSSIIFFAGQLLFSVHFLFYQDSYTCQGMDPLLNCRVQVCKMDEISRLGQITQITINSLANELGDFRCPSARDQLDNLIAIMFFGIAVGYLLLALFGQLVNKKTLMLMNFVSYIIGLAIVLIFPREWYAVGGGLLVAVLGISNCYIISFMFLIETVEISAREKAMIFTQSFYGIGSVFNIVLFLLFQDWFNIFLYCYLIPSIFLLAALCLFVVDTPMSLILRNPPQKALEKLLFMARVNGVISNLTLEDIKDARMKYEERGRKVQMKNVTVLEIFKFRSTRYLTLILILLQCTISFEFHAPSLMLSSFHLDIYINGFALASSQVLANFTAAFFISKFKRKLLSFACFGCTLASSIVLIFLWDQNQETQHTLTTSVAIIVLLFIFQMAITKQYSVFYVFSNQVFPTQARVISISLISLMGGLMTTVTSKVIGFCFSQNFPVMILFAIMSGVCILIVCFIPETFKATPKDLIEVLRQEEPKVSGDPITKSLINH